MHFAQPAFLIVALASGVTLTALFIHLALARRAALTLLGARHLLASLTASVSRSRRLFKQGLVVFGVMLFGVALARPQLGFRWEEAHRRGVDVLFAVDTSKSMNTPDLKPNRLERAKLAVHDLVQKFPDDRIGLVAFAGTAFLQTPLTLDHAIFDESLDALDTSVIPLGGTNVASALQVAQKALVDDTHKKVLVLLTDGEDLAGDALGAAQSAAKQGLVVYTVGVGTPRGELIPIAAADGQTAFVKDEAGQFVTSKLDDGLLRRIASATGGAYRALGDNGQGLEALYREELATLPRSDLAAQSQRVPIERYQWPLGLGLLCLGIEPLLSERRRVRRPTASRVTGLPARRAVTAAAAGIAALLVGSGVASASPQSAERAYQHGKFGQAQSEYAGAASSKPADARLSFNTGAAAYKNGDLDTAKKAFERALHTDDLKLQQRTYYNLGDDLYRSGERLLKSTKTEETIKSWKQSIAHYEAALRLDAKDADAQHNLEFVKRKLAELQKQDQQKQDQQKKDGGQGEKQDKKPAKNGADKQAAGGQGNTPPSKTGEPKDAQPQGQQPQGQQPQGQQPQGQQPQGQQPQGQQGKS
ncbi:MAG: VWA domain-containing protein, partial [Polyangiaceae bacterium]